MKKLEINIEDADFENIERRAKNEELSVNDYIVKHIYMNYNSNEAISRIDALINIALYESDDSTETIGKIKTLVEEATDLLDQDDYGDGEDYDD